MCSIIKAPKFVFKLKPTKIPNELSSLEENLTPNLTFDMLNYIASFIDVSDTYTLLSYLMAIPCSNYEIKKKFAEHYSKPDTYPLEYSNYLHKFMIEPTRILVSALKSVSLFNVNDLLNVFTNAYCETVLKRPNGRRFIIYLIKEQNKISQKEIVEILKKKGSKTYKTLHYTFPTLDILYNEQIARLSEYISCCDIDKHIYKQLQSYYKNSNIHALNSKERALLMEYYNQDHNLNASFLSYNKLVNNLIVKALQLNYIKIIDVLFENNLVRKNKNLQAYTEIDVYIYKLKIDSDEFKKARNIIIYFLEKRIEIDSYQNTICNMINFSFAHKNYDMVKFLLSLNNAREGISILLGYRKCGESELCNSGSVSTSELSIYQNYTLSVFEQTDYVLYDFLINNLPNGIDISIVSKHIVYDIDNIRLFKLYIYIIEKYVENFDNTDIYNNLNDNLNDKYYCDRKTLINMYFILINNSHYLRASKIALKEELNEELKEYEELLKKEEEHQEEQHKLTNQILREFIKKIYYKIRLRRMQTLNIDKLIKIAHNTDMLKSENHRNIDALIEYLISVPDFLLDNKPFTNIVKKKMIEFINEDKDESCIETAHMMQNIRKLNEICEGMKPSQPLELPCEGLHLFELP